MRALVVFVLCVVLAAFTVACANIIGVSKDVVESDDAAAGSAPAPDDGGDSG